MKNLKIIFFIAFLLLSLKGVAQEDFIIDFNRGELTSSLYTDNLLGIYFSTPYCSDFELTEIGVWVDSSSESGLVRFALYNNLNGTHRELIWESDEIGITGGKNEYVSASIPKGDIALSNMHSYYMAIICNSENGEVKIKRTVAPTNNGVCTVFGDNTLAQANTIIYPNFPDSSYINIAWYGAINMVAKGVPKYVSITPNETILPTLTGECVSVTDYPTAISDCDGTITATTSDPLEYTKDGSYTIHWVFKKGFYYSVEQTQTVIVDDVTDPDIPVLPNLSGDCSLEIIPPTTNDACVGTITGIRADAFSLPQNGTFTIVWDFEDGNGNSVQAPQVVSIEDNNPPESIVLLPSYIDCSKEAIPPTTEDACDGTVVGTTNDATSFPNEGTHTVQWTFEDAQGNTINANQDIIVEDVYGPEIADLPNLVSCCSLTVNIPIANDRCEGEINGTTTSPLEYTEQGTYEINWIFADEKGNSTPAKQKIIIKDSISPEISCIGNKSISLSKKESEYTITSSEFDPTVIDNCEMDSIYNNLNLSSSLEGVTLTAGQTSVTWIAVDKYGNVSECRYDIEIQEYVSSNSEKIEELSTLFPNPTHGIIHIQNKKEVILKIEIMDISGRIILLNKYNLKEVTVDLNEYEKGIYLINVYTGNTINSKNIILR